ncbi:hypothetical protein BC833DRAFT_610303 [Globomyces pollinis-pini]|nr:hypothetical protein BC833DRAFT_610303 [Globomyces pollinis-pini]
MHSFAFNSNVLTSDNYLEDEFLLYEDQSISNLYQKNDQLDPGNQMVDILSDSDDDSMVQSLEIGSNINNRKFFSKLNTCLRCPANCDGEPGRPCSRCIEFNLPCIYQPVTQKTLRDLNAYGNAYRFKSKVDIRLAGNFSRTEKSNSVHSKGRVIYMNPVDLQNAHQRQKREKEMARINHPIFEKICKDWNRVCPDNGVDVPDVTRNPNRMSKEQDPDYFYYLESTEKGRKRRKLIPIACNDVLDKLEENIDVESPCSFDANSIREAIDNKKLSEPITRYFAERFSLPSSDLLDAIHSVVGEYFSKEHVDLKKSTEKKDSNLLGKFSSETLLAFGILFQEIIRDTFPQSQGSVLSTDLVHNLAPNLFDLLNMDGDLSWQSDPLDIKIPTQERRHHNAIIKPKLEKDKLGFEKEQ